MNTPVTLKAGDVLLYGSKDFFGFVTSLKTWSPAVHVEVYIGNLLSVASRNGIGVNYYPYRGQQLIAVLRPIRELDILSGMKWMNVPYKKKTGDGVLLRPYGWLDLLRFALIKVPTNGWICSQFASMFLRECGANPFAKDYYAGSIDPGDFFVSPAFDWEWVEPSVLNKITT